MKLLKNCAIYFFTIPYFAIDGAAIVILTVLHASRDPATWQLRSSLQVHEP